MKLNEPNDVKTEVETWAYEMEHGWKRRMWRRPRRNFRYAPRKVSWFDEDWEYHAYMHIPDPVWDLRIAPSEYERMKEERDRRARHIRRIRIKKSIAMAVTSMVDIWKYIK